MCVFGALASINSTMTIVLYFLLLLSNIEGILFFNERPRLD